MAALEDLAPTTRQRLLDLDCPRYETTPFVAGRPLRERRVAIVTSAALVPRGEKPIPPGDNDFRALPASLSSGALVMSHVSVNFDRTGFQRDVNVVYPLDRLREMAAEGAIGSVADTHYAVMGASDPKAWGELADGLVARLRQESVDAVLLTPV
ncbi:MAG TPA: glycine/sarcosine/betaine reductase selenoprotein B family protein [Vineibacter sp.]|nr:glycine/sarcosine/betaine reductase selenoprotein B family protein [Vineibacter sp.]